jgi:hypothetical protein
MRGFGGVMPSSLEKQKYLGRRGLIALIMVISTDMQLPLGAFALACLLPILLFEESLPRSSRSSANVLGALGRLVVIGRDKGFRDFLLVIVVLTAPYATYLAVCSYVYIG